MKVPSLFLALMAFVLCFGQVVGATSLFEIDRSVDCSVFTIRQNGKIVGEFERVDRFAAAFPEAGEYSDGPGRLFRFGTGQIILSRNLPAGPRTDGAALSAAVAIEASGPVDGVKWLKGRLSLANPFELGVEHQKIDFAAEATKSFHYVRQQIYRKDAGSVPLGGLIGFDLICNFK